MPAWARDRPERLFAAGASFWLAFVARWFDVGWARPAWLEALPPVLLLLPALLFFAAWIVGRRRLLGRPGGEAQVRGLGTILAAAVGLSLLFRLPFLARGAAAAVTPDGALSGIVMLRILEGAERLVFVPNVPYSGSLKSHLGAVLALGMDPARAFGVASVLFYALFVAGVVRLAALLPGARAGTVLASGLYAAFAPPFVNRYSLSNDGNYVEVLALGVFSLLFALGLAEAPPAERRPWALALGLVTGLAFWCHLLAVIPLAAAALFLVLRAPRTAVRESPAVAAAFLVGSAPSLLWNAAHGGESFLYLLPGGPKAGGEAPGAALPERFAGVVFDHLPTLFGFDFGYGPLADQALRALGVAGTLAFVYALARAAGRLGAVFAPGLAAALALVFVNLGVATTSLPYIPGNARYVLFLFGPAVALVGWALGGHVLGRWALALLLGGGAAASLAQLPGTVRADTRWRGFVGDLEGRGVRFCYTDFYLATKINFLSAERIVCSAKLGPTTTEYFFDYRRRVEEAPAAAFVAVNGTAARRLEERLRGLGVAFVRDDFMKPTLRPARKVDPEELFPGRAFPLR